MPQDGKKLIKYMEAKNWRISAINILYLEDANADTWEPLPEQPDQWNDVRILVRNTGEIIMSAEATVEPGRYYTENRLDPLGAFRIKNDVQFKDAWEVGTHRNQYPALVQVADVIGYRDGNEDYMRPGDVQTEGVYGINHHTTGDDEDAAPPTLVGRWSAGCLVGRYAKTHYRVFMPTLINSGRKRFDAAVIPGDAFYKFRAN